MRFYQKLGLLVGLVLCLAVAGYSQWLVTEDYTKAADLIAGGGNPKGATDVGDIFIWKDSQYIYVEYVLPTPSPSNPWNDWYITETHVEIARYLEDIPQANGNPIPGQFTYSQEHEYVTHYTERIPLNGYSGPVYLAAHAVVCKLGGLEGLAQALPNSPLEFRVTHSSSVTPSYFPIVDIRSDTWLNGTHYNGWCIDVGHTISPGTWYWADVYSSYETLPAGIVDMPENLDLVNWVLNQNFVGKDSGGFGPYTGGDVQLALWTLIDVDTSDFPTLPNVSTDRVNQIVTRAYAEGEGYVPTRCGVDKVGIILVPYSADRCTRYQAVIIQVPLPCAGCETAWAANWMGTFWGYPFTGRNWATYLWLDIR